MNIEEAGKHLTGLLSKYPADYLEAHLEESQSSHLTYRGKELESSDKNNAVGGNIRALVKGGWGFVSFNSLDNLPGKRRLSRPVLSAAETLKSNQSNRW
jgi:TldD protein